MQTMLAPLSHLQGILRVVCTNVDPTVDQRIFKVIFEENELKSRSISFYFSISCHVSFMLIQLVVCLIKGSLILDQP